MHMQLPVLSRRTTALPTPSMQLPCALQARSPAPSLPTYTSRGASGTPPLMRALIAAFQNLGLNTSVSTPLCHTSTDLLRQSFLWNSSCSAGGERYSVRCRREVLAQ
jgi:hypothetical protein